MSSGVISGLTVFSAFWQCFKWEKRIWFHCQVCYRTHPTDLSSSFSFRQTYVTQRWSWSGSEMLFFLFSSLTALVRKLVAAVPPSPLWQRLWMAGCPALSSPSEARTAAEVTGHRKDPECHKTRWIHFSHCITIWPHPHWWYMKRFGKKWAKWCLC